METLFLQAKVLEEVEGEAVIQTGAAEILDKLRSNQGEGGKRERQRERERESDERKRTERTTDRGQTERQ